MLPFWYQLTQVVPDKIQEGRKTVVVVVVIVVEWTFRAQMLSKLMMHINYNWAVLTAEYR